METTYTCPVCRFKRMREPPQDWNICGGCGTEFNLNDANRTHEDLRAEWISNGMVWWSQAEPQPTDWPPRGRKGGKVTAKRGPEYFAKIAGKSARNPFQKQKAPIIR